MELFPSASAICLARPLSAGPAGFAGSAGASPGWSEIRVVFGVQLEAPRQVSRRNTWRKPLLEEAAEVLVLFVSWLGVMVTNATKRPEELMDGKILSVPLKAPSESVEIREMLGLQEAGAPTQLSRR